MCMRGKRSLFYLTAAAAATTERENAMREVKEHARMVCLHAMRKVAVSASHRPERVPKIAAHLSDTGR